ncbi:hypothetical protein BDY19DRAFT_613525 [Irpex rosettiformis]|uniref:Uncharacterized protein n=1 Tax=Irpex rosettiformis TaxID=378272 RepID=A0ACB8TP39_9APHY|nr:hypothetical protein BDY19DRAFT_613525 [Irpex rosettiformis]
MHKLEFTRSLSFKLAILVLCLKTLLRFLCRIMANVYLPALVDAITSPNTSGPRSLRRSICVDRVTKSYFAERSSWHQGVVLVSGLLLDV